MGARPGGWGLMTDNLRLNNIVSHASLHCEKCAADGQRFANTAATSQSAFDNSVSYPFGSHTESTF